MSDTERISKLEKEIEELKNKMGSSTTKEKKERKPREPSAYNNFIKEHLAKLKKTQGDKYNHKEAFKSAAEAWAKSKK